MIAAVYGVAAPIAFAVALLVVGAAASRRLRHLLPDRPGERSLHASTTPRSGGFGIVAGLLAGALAVPAVRAEPDLLPVAAGLLLLVAVSAVDDARGLPAGLRLAAHLGAAAAVVLGTGNALAWPIAVVAVVAIGWATNLYNFMDGADGLAGGVALVGFFAYALAAGVAGDLALAAVAAASAAAAGGFLVFNFAPARIFMGDVGSISLGFLAGVLGLLGERRGAWPAAFAPTVFAVFLVDATLTVALRARRGERVWQAHREHAYQRLVLAGLGHRRVALVYYVLAVVSSLAALATLGRATAVSIAVGAGVTALLATAYGVVVRRLPARR